MPTTSVCLSRPASAGLDDVGVDGALSQVLDWLAIGLELLRHGEELFPELRTDDAALLLGLGHAGQKLGITVLGVDVDKVDVNLIPFPEGVHFDLIEPLDHFFKDEVRALGLALGLPGHIVFRQPFPGPGLAIRIIGAVMASLDSTARRMIGR